MMPEHNLTSDLARPHSYPSPTPGDVSLCTTHASWVFLTDHDAWKVKRPVNFGFLDFSNHEKRLRCCLEEVRLGARLAPDIYLGVVPIYLGIDGYSFVGPGVVVDHAVRMRRLDDRENALALMRTDNLTPEHLGQLATQLADFYAGAPATPGFGSPAILAQSIVENHEQTRPFLDRYVGGRGIEDLFHWQQGALFALGPRLTERIALGHVREGHGDLRLEHVYFPSADRRAIVIDPIDFNPAFRCADTALDVAFLAMELEANGRADLASYFLSCFARETDDYGFYPLLDLFLSYRAWVRAKVACFVAADPSTDDDKRNRKIGEARHLFDVAQAHARRPSGLQHVLAVGGMIATGKSTLAERLGRELRLPVVSSDWTRKHLAGVAATENAPAAAYDPAFTRHTYAEMLRRAQPVLDSGRGVILDATFRDPEHRKAARDFAIKNGRPFLFVELDCDEVTLRERLRRRAVGPSVSDARESLLPWMRTQFRPAEELASTDRMVLEATLSSDNQVGRVKTRLVSLGTR